MPKKNIDIAETEIIKQFMIDVLSDNLSNKKVFKLLNELSKNIN